MLSLNKWVAFDDESAMQMKADFACSQCLGGVMISDMSFDTKINKTLLFARTQQSLRRSLRARAYQGLQLGSMLMPPYRKSMHKTSNRNFPLDPNSPFV